MSSPGVPAFPLQPPPAPPPPPNTIAYRRYLRYLPEYKQQEPSHALLEDDMQSATSGGGEEWQCQASRTEIESEARVAEDVKEDYLPDVSVSSLVRQYTDMLSVRNATTSLTSTRSCSSLLPGYSSTAHPRRHSSVPHSEGTNARKWSVISSNGERHYHPRSRSFSLLWSGDTLGRWMSDPNLALEPHPSYAPPRNSGHAPPRHATSLAQLDSATSDEGCPGDDGCSGGSRGTPPPSPVFRGYTTSHLSGLITPFRSLSPASSMGSHLGSMEDLPLVRSMSVGHILDHWIRSHSADSAVEVEDEALAFHSISPAHSPGRLVRRDTHDSNLPSVGCSSSKHSGCVNDDCRKAYVSEQHRQCPIGSVVSGVSNDSEMYNENNKESEIVEKGTNHDEETVEIRRKIGSVDYNSFVPQERRHGDVNGEVLLRRARGCGMVQVSDMGPRQVLRTPSVVISDHSGGTISLTVALASSDFSLDKLDNLQHSASPSLSVADDASRKVSSCSSCSSVSTVDFTTPLTLTPLRLDSLSETPRRRISNCSTCSNLSASEDEVEHLLPQPPQIKKSSNWRKVRNIVQWTPFIQTYKKHKYPWVQLAGHQGNFRAGYKQGTILKKLCPVEEKALESITVDVLRPYVPRYTGVVEGADGEKYLQLEDLLSSFALPCVMDIKMGVRTYLEDELAKARVKPKLRKDMYEKMIQIDPKAPTEAEHKAKAVTKPRYMVWRETISSTATQGFRIEGVRRGDGSSSKDFKTTRTREQILACLNSFLQGYAHAASRYIQQLKSIKVTLEASTFFKTHELIGSSLLFVHNDTSALVRMIDFAKTIPLPGNVSITHRSPWSEGTHEDGYLLGLDNLIDLFSDLEETLSTNGATSPNPVPAVPPQSVPATSPPVPATSPPPVPATSSSPPSNSSASASTSNSLASLHISAAPS